MKLVFLYAISLQLITVFASLQSCQKMLFELAMEAQIEGLIPLIQKSAPYLSYSGKNINEFGLYDSCLRKNYLYSSVIITLPGGIGANFYGLCHAQNCTTEDLNTPQAKQMIKLFLNQSGIADRFNISVSDLDYSMIDPQQPLFDNFQGMTITIIILVLIFLTTLALPMAQIFFHFKTRKQRYQLMYNDKPSNTNIQGSALNEDCDASNLKPTDTLLFNPKDSLGIRILKDFSIIENYRQLITLPTQDANLTIFDGFRTLAFLMVIFGHQFGLIAGATFKLELYREFNTWLYLNLINMLYSVDMFFWIGGFFIGFVLYDQKKTNQIHKNPASILMVILHRLLRIWPCYILSIMINTYIGPHTGSGPRWFQSEQGFECKTGWRNILFIDNWFNDQFYCFGWGWYLSNDIQMFLVSLIPLYVYVMYNKTIGKAIVIGILFITQITGVIVSFYYEFLIPGFALLDPNQMPWYYFKPYCRAPPYFLGLILGIMYREHKAYQQKQLGETPALSQLKSMLTKKSNKRIFILVSYGAGALIVLTLWFGWRDIQLNNADYSQKFQSFWYAFCRIFFCIGLSLLALPNILGMPDVFNTTIMGNQFFKFLAKISFTGYLLHYTFLVITMCAFYQTPSFNFANTFTYFVGDSGLTIIFAVLLTLVVEMPFGKLEQRLMALLAGGKKEIVNAPDLSAQLLKH